MLACDCKTLIEPAVESSTVEAEQNPLGGGQGAMTALRLCFRTCLVLFIFAAVPLGSGDTAHAGYSALMMDMRTGKVIEERNARTRRQPASLTKMMTLYLTFEALETGQIDLDQTVRVSRRAARQPPSKLYLHAGQRVSIRHLIRATAIKSANDAAMVLAEAVGGSKRAFARMMTDKARQLGMTDTTFRNPHGLTERGHLSTARDMARLARAVRYHFPEYFNVFGRRTAHAAGKRIYSTNRLLRSYNGAVGMKTGYTRAAGYNLVAVARRGPREVISVLMGGRSSTWRWRKSARLLDEALAKAPRHATLRRPRLPGVELATAPLPAGRPATHATGFGAIAAAFGPDEAVAATGSAVDFSGSPHAPTASGAPARRVGAAGVALAGAPSRRAARTPGSAVPLPDSRPGWSVQIGAFRNRVRAVAHLNALTLAGIPALASGESQIARETGRSGATFYKVRIVGLDQSAAREACSEMRRLDRDCLAIAP